nr:hypothetical protein [Aeromonas veronii]
MSRRFGRFHNKFNDFRPTCNYHYILFHTYLIAPMA